MTVYWTHTKTGHHYKIKEFAIAEGSLEPIVIYEAIDNPGTWTRTCSQFFDGRFVQTINDLPISSDIFRP